MAHQSVIKLFKHCDPDIFIFCFQIPHHCPFCKKEIISYLVPPCVVPSPLNENEKPKAYSIVIKPTNGSFMSDYQENDDLHIGITNLYGDVFNFDSVGVQKEKEGWDECACIVLIKDGSPSDEEKEWMKKWNKCLSSSLKDTQWTKERYDENQLNCYDYVIRMLSKIQGREMNKQDFVQDHILPTTKKVAKYLKLHKSILWSENGCHFQQSGQ
ncbi:MKRN2 opposite strand protein-like [Clytia hemisphaerica]